MGRKGRSAWLLTPCLKDADDLLADSSGSTCKDAASSDIRPRPRAGGKNLKEATELERGTAASRLAWGDTRGMGSCSRGAAVTELEFGRQKYKLTTDANFEGLVRRQADRHAGRGDCGAAGRGACGRNPAAKRVAVGHRR